MGRPISYEMQMMFVGSPGAFEEAMNTGSGITRLDYIQSYDFSFNVERNPLKQIGSDSFATRQTQFAPDVNLNIQYYLNDGWNDKFIGLDISPDSSGNPFDTILSSTGDRNFYVSIAQDDGIDQNLKSGIVNSNVLGIGNCYITNYEISVSVNELATVSCSFVGGNANVQDYATSKYLPSVNTLSSGQNAEDANKNFALNFISNARTEEYFSKAKDNFTGGCPYSKCKITPDFQSSATTSPLTFGFFDAVANNFQSMQFSVQFDRKPLYGFGNNHPYTRKVQRPIVATLALSALIDDFQAENLSKIFHKEGGAKSSILIEFFNFSDVKKFGLALDNLTLESYSLGARIGGRVLVETNWTVEIINGSGSNVKMIGSYRNAVLGTTLVNESFSVPELFSEIDAYDPVSYAIDKNGYIWSWGDSNPEVLGTFKQSKKTPAKIFKTFVVNKISNSDGSQFFIDKNGIAWGWGYNDYGQLGDNSTISRSSPVSVYGNKTFCQIVNARTHTIGIDKNGKAWGWGVRPRLGSNDTSGLSLTPIAVLNSGVYILDPLIYPYTLTFCKITARNSQSSGIDQYGKAWAWGYNNYGNLGVNSTLNWAAPYPVYGNKTFCEIQVGLFHTVAIDKYGKAWTWGRNLYGELGNASFVASVRTPVAVCGNKTFCKIAAGSFFSLGIDKNGLIWSWGENDIGQLGNSLANYSERTPVSIGGVKKTFCKISAGANYVLAIDKYGKSWGWGSSIRGEIGNKQLDDCSTPKAIAGADKTFVEISERFGIDINGKVWGWGNNRYGQLGNNSFVLAQTPVPVYGGKTFCKIAASRDHTLAIDKNGKAWGWGYNGYGQIGVGTVDSCQVTPVSVYGNKTFCKIFAYDNRSYAIDKNNKAWGWGYNGYSSLGIGSGSYNVNSPFALCTSKTFCDIQVFAALDKDGKVWGWGYFYDDTFGFGVGLLSSPQSMVGNRSFCKINANAGDILAIDKNGKLWTWGYNLKNVGDGISQSTSPIAVCTNKTFCEIYKKAATIFAIDNNKNGWAWGNGEFYAFGRGAILNYVNTPVAIYGNKKFRKINKSDGSYIGNNVIALDLNGKIWTWGSYLANLGQNIPSTYTPMRIHNF